MEVSCDILMIMIEMIVMMAIIISKIKVVLII